MYGSRFHLSKGALVALFVFFALPAFVFATPPTDSDATTLSVSVVDLSAPACSNGLDDDNDGKNDFPTDPGCSSTTDTDETDPVSSGGGSSGGGSSGGGGGGGGGGVISSGASVIFIGRSYPTSKITVLKDGIVAASATIGSDGLFNIRLDGLSSGSYIFGVYATDAKGLRSPTVTAGVMLSPSVVTTVSGVFIPPTIDLDKSEVKKGSPLTIFGVATPESSVSILVNSETELSFDAKADKTGFYSYTFLTTPLALGNHSTQSQTSVSGEVSGMSRTLGFKVGTRDVAKKAGQASGGGDLNGDGKVNLVDFSVMAFWYKKSTPPPAYDLNGDGKVNIVDFSILASQWTG